MLKTDIGGLVNAYALAAATGSYVPLADRAALIRRINLTNPSANDTWRLSVGGRELMAFRELTVGGQQMLRTQPATAAMRPNFFDFCRQALGIDPSVPVPFGQTATLKSDGGATADIAFEAEEHDPQDIVPGLVNHYRGSQFILPIALANATGYTAAGHQQLDTQHAPSWIPSLLKKTSIPVGWKIEILALFLEGSGVNTFSGAANHVGATQDLAIIRNGEFLFTHQATPDGLLNQGLPAVAGSANTVFGQRSAFMEQFGAAQNDPSENPLATIFLNGGDNIDWQLNVVGDETGTASYANALQVLIARVTVPAQA